MTTKAREAAGDPAPTGPAATGDRSPTGQVEGGPAPGGPVAVGPAGGAPAVDRQVAAEPVVGEPVVDPVVVDAVVEKPPVGEPVRIELAVPADAGEILTVQRAAYVAEAQLYGDPFIPPLVESAEQIRKAFEGDAVVLKAVSGARIVGAVRARCQDGTCLIGRLVVVPDLHGRGIGRRLMTELEERMAGRVRICTLFTGHLSERNLRLYRRLGYREVRRERVADHLTLVHLRKSLS